MRTHAELSEPDVRALLARIAARDESALRELHRLYARRILQFAAQRLRDDDGAQTVMIDTLFEVWKHPDRFRGESAFTTWLLGIARYKVLDAYRGAPRPHDDIDDHAEILESPDPTPEQAISTRQQQARLADCVERLNAAQRECLQLVLQDGLPLAEVAQLQGVPEGTVKTRLFHARRNLRGCVEGTAAADTR